MQRYRVAFITLCFMERIFVSVSAENKVRFRYSKTGRASYVSHLDLMATMQRAFLRAGLELKYSQGFNPHPYMSVALPLPVGSESQCELMDVGLISDMLPEVKAIKLPDGFAILDAYKPARKFNEIAWIEISAKMHYDTGISKGIADRINQRFMEDSIVISKRTKRGIKDLDIAPFIKDVEVQLDGSILLTAKISAQNPTLNAADLESALDDEVKPDYIDLKRIDIYDSNMILFR